MGREQCGVLVGFHQSVHLGRGIVGDLLDIGETFFELGRVGEGGFQALKLGASSPPRDRKRDGTDCSDFRGREQQAESESAQRGFHGNKDSGGRECRVHPLPMRTDLTVFSRLEATCNPWMTDDSGG